MEAIKSIPVPAHVWVYSVENHAELKPQILEAIRSMGEFSYRSAQNSLANTDWHLAANVIRPYYDIVRPVLTKHAEATRIAWAYDSVSIGRVWFQQYNTGDFHSWHTHGDCTFSSVYYVDLPDGSPKTSFMYEGTDFEVNVKEGDILTFPSYLAHRSAVNTGTDQKTVIAFNSNAAIGY